MPQDGSNNYFYPPGTPGIPDQTIESEAYNTFLDDLVVNDLNIARPVHRGGTGATIADEALANLGAEKASQVVTNYDSHVFVAGSFISTSGATSAPDAINNFSGICHLHNSGAILLEACAYNAVIGSVPGLKYIRQKWSTWGPWVEQVGSSSDMISVADFRYVNTTGDTMTGDLTITKSAPLLSLNKSGSGQYNQITGNVNGAARWLFSPGDGTPETGGNSGSDLAFHRYADNGSYLGTPFNINRATGLITGSANDPATPQGISTKQYTDTQMNTRVAKIGDQMSGNLTLQTPTGGVVLTLDRLSVSGTGADVLGRSGGAPRWLLRMGEDTLAAFRLYRYNDAGAVSGTPISIDRYTGDISMEGVVSTGNINTSSVTSGSITSSGNVTCVNVAASGKVVTSGNIEPYGHILFNSVFGANRWQTDGTFVVGLKGYQPGGGSWTDSSDVRIKNVEGDYPRGLNEVRALRPVLYTYKGNDTDVPPANNPLAPEMGKDGNLAPPSDTREAPSVPYPNSLHYGAATEARKFAGLVAQEVETVFPEMVKKRAAYIDGQPVNDLRDLDTTPLIFALINCVKELATRIEQLEAPG